MKNTTDDELDKAAINEICDVFDMDEALAIFNKRVAAHQNALLDRLLEQEKLVIEHGPDFDDMNQYWAVPVEAIEAERKL